MSRKALTPTNVPALASAPSTPAIVTGDLYFDTTLGSLRTYNGTSWVSGSGSGTVTSITAGTGLSGGTITTSGTIAIDSTVATLTGTQTLTNKTLTFPIIDNIRIGYTTTVTAAGTTTLTATSNRLQFFTGTSTQTLVLPVTSTLALGVQYSVHNNSTGAVTVQSSGLNTIATVAANTSYLFTCILISGTTAASWDADFTGSTAITGTGSNVLSISPTLTGTPLSTTAAVDTNTTQIATTAFVLGQASGSNPLALGSVAQGTSFRYSRQDHVHPTTGLGLTSGTLAQFAATTSAQLAGVISDETGSGSLVFGTSPTVATPTLTLSTTTSTTAGRIAWDNTNDQIVIGDGTVTKRFSAVDDGIQFVPSLLLGGM